jgi:hypothetical protein
MLAVAIVMALLVAPLCAPLCVARSCSSTARHEPCHEMANISAKDGEQYLAPAKDCGANDFSAVLVETDDRSLPWHMARSNSAPALTLMRHSPGLGLESLHLGPGRSGIHRVPLESKLLSPLNTILRI